MSGAGSSLPPGDPALRGWDRVPGTRFVRPDAWLLDEAWPRRGLVAIGPRIPPLATLARILPALPRSDGDWVAVVITAIVFPGVSAGVVGWPITSPPLSNERDERQERRIKERFVEAGLQLRTVDWATSSFDGILRAVRLWDVDVIVLAIREPG